MFIFNYETIVDPVLRDVRQSIPRFAGMSTGDRVLDVCCGTGAQVLEYGRQGIAATGIDIHPDMLNVAAKNRKKLGLANTSFQLGDAASLPYPNGYFDYASISFGLHDRDKVSQDKAVSEMKRVVRQEGALVFIDYQVPPPGHIWARLARIVEFLAGGSHYQGFKDYLKNGGLEEILRNHRLREEYRTLLKSGLVLVLKAKNN